MLVVKADNAFDLQWGHSFTAPGKTTLGYGIVQPLNGSGYVTSGTARGGVDSLFLFRIAENGTPGWATFSKPILLALSNGLGTMEHRA